MLTAIGVPEFSDSTLGVLTALGVALAAIAAITGIVSVRQGSRAWRAASRPLLHMTVFRDPETGVCTIEILNSGGGTALGATLLFVSGSYEARGRFGNLAPGRRVVLNTDPMPDVVEDPSAGVVSCYEDEARRVAQAFFVSHSPGRRRRYRKRLWRDVPSDDEMLAAEFPNVPLDRLESVGIHTPMLTQP
jgi:hypothetical protein